MARSTVFRFKGRDNDPRKVGKELGVHAVLVGMVNQVNNSLILDIEMIDVRSGAYLWGAKYKRSVKDLLTLHEDLAKEISENLRIKLNRVEERQITKLYTDEPQAYHLYMKGRYFWNKRSVLGVKQAIKYFRRAIRYDTGYSLAFAGLADSYIILSSYGLSPPRETMPKAKTAALKALDIDNELAEAHVSLGNIKSSFELDWSDAMGEFQRAIKLNSCYAQAYQYYANFLVKVGQIDRAIVEINKAYEIDPLSLSVNLAMGKIYYFARRYDDAVKKGRELLEFEPRFGPANGLIGLTYLEMNRYQDAIREFKAMMEFSAGEYKVTRDSGDGADEKPRLPDSDPEAVALLGYAYALAGQRTNALQVLGELQKLLRKRYVQPHTIALIYIGLGDTDKAFEWLERAFSDKSSTLTYIKVAPFFDSLRVVPQFEEMVRRMGLQAGKAAP
jgi:tetratricopeptide (TPR) repeat protein